MVAVVVLFLHLGAIRCLVDVGATVLSAAETAETRAPLVVFAGGRLVVLPLPAVLSVLPPKGPTRYGARHRQHPAAVS